MYAQPSGSVILAEAAGKIAADMGLRYLSDGAG